ncbi:MAG TPA: hypothetical protein VGW38_24720 [Chloroflexota bacterium]|nr:hypothetical protein [Chloroflexota bacterium]
MTSKGTTNSRHSTRPSRSKWLCLVAAGLLGLTWSVFAPSSAPAYGARRMAGGSDQSQPPRAFLLDPGAAHVANVGLTEEIGDATARAGFTLSLQHAYVDANRIIVSYTVSGPPRRAFRNFRVGNVVLTDGSGTRLPSRGAMGAGVSAGIGEYLEWFDAAPITGSLHPEGDLAAGGGMPTGPTVALHLTVGFLEAIEWIGAGDPDAPTPPIAIPALAPPPGDSVVAAQPVTDTTSPIRVTRVQGPFAFDFQLVVSPAREPQVHEARVVGTDAATIRRLVVSPSEARIYLSGGGQHVLTDLSVGGWRLSEHGPVPTRSWTTQDGLTALSVAAPLYDRAESDRWIIAVLAEASLTPATPEHGSD